MDSRAAISAQAVDIQNDRQHKGFIKVTLHVPAEIGARLTDTLGWPTYTQPVAVALARLDPSKIKSGDNAPGREVERNLDRPSTSRSHKPVDESRRLAQRAGILCSELTFHKFLNEAMPNGFIGDAEGAASVVRLVCGVETRADIKPGTDAARKFEQLEGRYLGWRDHDMPAVLEAA